MVDEVRRRTRYKRQPVEPGAWWRASRIYIRPGGRIYYDLLRADSIPDSVTDRRGRSALESFTALDFQAMTAALESYRPPALEGSDAWSDSEAAGRVAPFEDFVRTFGPIGVNWGGRFRVFSGSVRRLQARPATPGTEAEDIIEVRPSNRPAKFWTVSFAGHGPARLGAPDVREELAWPGLDLAQRRELEDDALDHDEWRIVADAQAELRQVLEVVEAVVRGVPGRIRAAMLAILNDENAVFDAPDPGPWHTDYGAALVGFRPHDVFRPFRLPPHQVNWPMLGRRFTGDLISRQIDFAIPLLQVDRGEEYFVQWRATSVLEVIYLQLMDHVRRRPEFGVATCGYCGGAILRKRRPGRTEDQWHTGCRAGRVSAWRGSRRSSGTKGSR